VSLFGAPEVKSDHFAPEGTGVPAAPASAGARRIIDKCEEVWEANRADCNRFVKAVADGVGIQEIPANATADAILTFLNGNAGWVKLAAGDDQNAKAAADEGKFVIGGLSSGELNDSNGHVVVVVSGPFDPAHNRYPSAYWGKLNGVGSRNKTINYAFLPPQRDCVRYFVRALPQPPT